MAFGAPEKDNVKVKGVDSGGVDREITAIDDGSGVYRLAVDTSMNNANDNAVILWSHHKIHLGDSYVHSSYEDLGLNEYYRIKITTTADTYPHIILASNVKNNTIMEFYEGSSVTAGAALTSLNRNRESSNTTGVTLNAITAVTTPGTLLYSEIFYATQQTAVTGQGGLQEFILKDSTVYMVQYQAIQPANQVNVFLNWYE